MLKTICLNGTWDFIVDMNPKYHWNTDTYPVPAYSKSRICRRHWMRVPVPGCWQKYAQRYDIYEGVCWFAREFELTEPLCGARAMMHFDAVNYACRVFVNDVEVGGHETGYTPFELDCTEAVRVGQNHVAVCVDNRDTQTVWPNVIGYFNYGGIHRGVRLNILNRGDIEWVRWVPRWSKGGATLRACGQIMEGGGARVTLSCAGAMGCACADETGAFAVELPVVNARPWAPDDPALFEAVLTVTGDGEAMTDERRNLCGFKRLEIVEAKPYLNGNPFHFNGVCYVYDSPTSGLTMTQEQIDQDVRLMKEAGINAVRCHYPMDEAFYAACDRLGLLVWIEPVVYCYHPRTEVKGTLFADPKAIELAHNMAREMISVAHAHVSVSIYGIGNECNTYHPESERFFRDLAAAIRRDDDQRLISYAALYGTVGPIAGVVDILGVNSYWGWYDKLDAQPDEGGTQTASEARKEPIDLTPLHAMLKTVFEQTNPTLALFLTEFGADSVPGYFSKSRDLWSENYHADLLDEILTAAAQYPRIIGTFPFCFTDYRDPSKDSNGYWNELNLKGLVDYHRNLKMPYRRVAQRYGGCAAAWESEEAKG